MKISIQSTAAKAQAQDCAIFGIYAHQDFTPSLKKINLKNKDSIQNILKRLQFQAKRGETIPLFNLPQTDYDHMILVGCGKRSAISPRAFKDIALAAAKAIVQQKVVRAVFFLTEVEVDKKDTAWKVKQIVQGINEACYRFDAYKTEKDTPVNLKEIVIQIHNPNELKPCKIAALQGQAIATGVNLAKDLGNTPSNVCTPTYLAKAAQQIARDHKRVKIKILDENAMRRLGMGAILGVTKGSAEPAKFIVLEYKNAKKQAPVALVGKGITFDTGGNSIKPADSMVGMKYDMCGAATVLGTVKACAELDLETHVVGIIAAVENMPGGSAYKPEDILTSMSGKTIEVISTDAEGRLILADALTYSKRYDPDVVIDIATLTGAVVIALGFHATGLLSNNQQLADELLEAGEESNDRAWQLPLWEDYQEQIKSPFADISNTGGRAAGAITAACFLSHFTKDLNWAHLDVAGTAAMMMGSAERRATGRPIPLLMQFLINRAEYGLPS